MPIIVNNIEWNQTTKCVIIQVPLNGASQSQVDVFTSSQYIKASYDKYFFEVFLRYPIVVETSKCTITGSSVIFELVKVKDEIWDSLHADIPKHDKLEIKKKLIEEEHTRFQNACKEQRQRKGALKQTAVTEQIALDTKQRALIEDIKAKEKAKALGDVREWQDTNCEKVISKPKNEVLQKKDRIAGRTKANREPSEAVPLPRNSRTVEVSFTSREFPTPSRESRLEEENEWLRNQAKARRSAGFISEDLRPEEKNPQYLKLKGDEFYKAGNYLGAISAYSYGIKLSEKYVDNYIGRARAQFSVGNFNNCIKDCSKALELMKPEVPANLLERSECICRRGVALCKIGLVEQGHNEITISLSLGGDNEMLKTIINYLEK